MNPEPNPHVQLLAKLRRVYDAVPFVEKRGRNTSVGSGYSFAQALDVIRDVRAALLAENVIVIPSATQPQHFTETGGKSFVTTVLLSYRFFDVETAAMIEVPWVGSGADVGGDKGLYKAYTGGLKYALLSLFLLPMTDDPEHDGLSAPNTPEAAPAPETTVDKDAERPAAPRVPVDRAKSMLDAAEAAGLATVTRDDASKVTGVGFTPVMKAQLATLGVSQLGQLNVDQAEAMEAFIVAEAGGQA